MEGVSGKVRRSDATPTNFFSVDFSFKFGNDVFIAEFWRARGSLQKAYWQNWRFVAIPSICNQRSLHRRIRRFLTFRYNVRGKILWSFDSFFIPILKFRSSEKATKVLKNLPLVLKCLSKRQNKFEIKSNFVAFSQYLGFNSF